LHLYDTIRAVHMLVFLCFGGCGADSSYLKEMDYSDKIGTGTYRIGATFDADGHSITRYSNSRTF